MTGGRFGQVRIRLQTCPFDFGDLLVRQRAVQILTDYIRIFDRPNRIGRGGGQRLVAKRTADPLYQLGRKTALSQLYL